MTARPTVSPDLDGVRSRHRTLLSRSRAEPLRNLAIAVFLVALAIVAVHQLDVSIWRVLSGFARLGDFIVLMFPPSYGTEARLVLYLKALAETLAIAFIGTLVAALLAFPMALLASRNVMANRLVRLASRRFFDSIRGVDTLIWALVWINVVGLGPFAGALAIATSDFGSFGKLFSEAIETSDKRPVEGVVAAGGNHAQVIGFAILPQVLPVVISQILYYFESNTRSATIIGIAGAGGIGMHLSEQIRILEWQHVSCLILLILVTVGIIDWISARIRHAMIGRRPD